MKHDRNRPRVEATAEKMIAEFDVPDDVAERMHREAAARHTTVDDLALRLICAVARDDLFDLVLDP